MPITPPGKWKPADATDKFRECAASDDLDIDLTIHAGEQMADRDLLMGDLRHLLKSGFVYDEAEPATREGYFKYTVEGTTPNSGGRSVKTVVIPSGVHALKIVTVMWRDEK